MSFDWNEFLAIAHYLLEQPTTSAYGRQALLRTSINRAYFATYWAARSRLEREGYSVPADRAHVFVRNKFRASIDPVCQIIADDLNRLRLERIDADYDDSAAVSSAHVSYLLHTAYNAILMITALPDHPAL